MKYIVIGVKSKSADVTQEIPFIFPDFLVHRDVYEMMVMHLLRVNPVAARGTIFKVSGGFLSSLDCSTPNACHGKSESLGVKSRGEKDSALIRTADYGGMYA